MFIKESGHMKTVVDILLKRITRKVHKNKMTGGGPRQRWRYAVKTDLKAKFVQTAKIKPRRKLRDRTTTEWDRWPVTKN